jgi:hypothetical protein
MALFFIILKDNLWLQPHPAQIYVFGGISNEKSAYCVKLSVRRVASSISSVTFK